MFLGSGVSADGDGKPSPNAGQDSRDDGVALTSVFPGATANFTVTASANGFLNGWIDFNQNGSWSDAGEHISGRSPSRGWDESAFLPGTGRCLLGTTLRDSGSAPRAAWGLQALRPTARSKTMRFSVDTSSWQNPPIALDVNDDDNVNPQDIIIVINELTNHAFSDPETGQLPADSAGRQRLL